MTLLLHSKWVKIFPKIPLILSFVKNEIIR